MELRQPDLEVDRAIRRQAAEKTEAFAQSSWLPRSFVQASDFGTHCNAPPAQREVYSTRVT